MHSKIIYLLLIFSIIQLLHLLVAYDYKKEIDFTDDILEEMPYFGGLISATKQSQYLYKNDLGLSNEELIVPLELDDTFGIGGNTKLFVAVALYQLQEKGIVKLSSPVSHYLTNDDFKKFGFPEQYSWCPKVKDQGVSCEMITFIDLLSMSSGLIDAYNCKDVPPDSPYCMAMDERMLYTYNGTIAYYVGQFINSPLIFKPGTKYSYSNPNFILASYMIEKLSGMALEDYLDKFILKPLDLDNTRYDPYSGSKKVINGYIDSYKNVFKTPQNINRVSVGNCRPYLSSGVLSGSGGMVSSTFDMVKWYEKLFTHMGSNILSEVSVKEILKPRTPIKSDTASNLKPFYGQGIVVFYETQDSFGWPKRIMYCGRLKCTFTCMAAVRDEKTGIDTILTSWSNHAHHFLNESIPPINDAKEMMNRLINIWTNQQTK